jgi:uncharacterized ferritin-like protein (DUF455 family)
MNVFEFCHTVLFSPSLEAKLLNPSLIDWSFDHTSHVPLPCPVQPSRPHNLRFSNEQPSFPRRKAFLDKAQRARALHFFANHELLAIEILATSVLIFPCFDGDESFLKTTIATLKDEQKHLKLYCTRMKELGMSFGELPVNDFFWDKMLKVESRDQFIALLSLTFESANLDFASYYEAIFHEVGDFKSAEIMREVYLDEISHVKTGVHWMNRWRGEDSLWNYYLKNLPEFVTPARSKGMTYLKEARLKAGLDEDFVAQLEQYTDEFRVTRRRQWDQEK